MHPNNEIQSLLAAQDESKVELQNLHRQAEELKNNEIRGLLAAQDESKAELQNLRRQVKTLKFGIALGVALIILAEVVAAVAPVLI